MITVVVGKEIEKLKGEFESVINGMNMVGEIPYNVYSELFDVGTECIQKAYELGKSELEAQIEIDAKQIRALQKQNGELTDKCRMLEEKLANADYQLEGRDLEIKELKAQIEKMKCCYNCKHSRTEYEHCKTDKHEKWEIKEK